MGFFSRFFSSDASDKAESNHCSAPDDAVDSSELGLDAKAAAAVLSEIDIDTAIAAHENWKLRLRNYVDGTSSETLFANMVCMDNRCDLGKWLHGPGAERLGKYPAFSMLLARHKYFHVQASNVVELVQANEKGKADQMINSSYRQASNQVVFLLKELKRGLGA